MDSCSSVGSSEALALLKEPKKQELPLWKKTIFLIWTFLECLMFSGVMYGWASLVYILKDDEIYEDLCKIVPGNISSWFHVTNSSFGGKRFVCNDQDSEFELVFTIGSSVTALVSLATGNINYRYGTRVARIMATVLFVCGSLLIAFESKEIPWLIFPGLTLVGVGGIPLLVTSTQIANFFPKHNAAVIGLLNGAFDASAGVLLLVKIAFDNGVSRRDSFIFLAALNISVLASTFIIYPRWFIRKPGKARKAVPGPDDEVNANEKELSIEASQSETNIRGSLMSPLFMFHLIWFCFLFLHFTYFVSSLNAWLNYVLDRDREKVSYYTNVHLYSLLPAIVVAWLAGIIYDGAKKYYRDEIYPLRGKIKASVVPLAMTSVSAVIVSLLMLSPDEYVLYITFIMVMVFRAFLYATATSFLLLVFPLEQFGILYSTSLIFAGALAFLQYALFTWSQHAGFNTVNGFLAGVAGLTLVHPIFQFVSGARASRTRRYYEKI